jgi:DNA primase
MLDASDPLVAVRLFHDALPSRIRDYLHVRGISDGVIDTHLLGWDGRQITIPIFDREGRFAFLKRAKDPEDTTPGPKMLTPPGCSAELYGWERLRGQPPRIIICEGEFDRLVLEGQGIAAVTSTGGARLFRAEWARNFEAIDEVYLCFDRDQAGREGALSVARVLPKARIVELPEEVGPSGDVTDFFVRLGKTRDDFLALLEAAKPGPPPEPVASAPTPAPGGPVGRWAERVERIKTRIAIADVVRQYVELRGIGERLRGLCPFHDDHEPSLVVFPASGRFYCFGCAARGDVIAFLMAVEHVSFGDAVAALERLAETPDHHDGAVEAHP